ncbi:MAG: molybdate ABC transporter substrate-binding protein [Gemmatimonadota bacterium]|nr:molybdate ABC transporter substrate-binding protein [Gemmatimonadota bacterium]
MRRLLIALFWLASASGCAGEPASRPITLTISAAVSLREVVSALIGQYEAAHPEVRVRANFAGSGTLQRQIERGAPVDLFLSAAPVAVGSLQARGLIAPGSAKVIAGNQLVLVTARDAGGVRGFRDLAAPSVSRVALGAPASVPAGAYAVEVLRWYGVEREVLAKAVMTQHVRQALVYVERGEVDAGIVYRTDAARSPGVRVVATAPAGSHTPIHYVLAVVSATPHPHEARAFAAYLASPDAAAVLRRAGFAPPPTKGAGSTRIRPLASAIGTINSAVCGG